jgi:RNA polymerase sigma-70 factor (ECF subfamily)
MDDRARSNANLGSTSAGLLAKVRENDDLAWRRLVEIYGPLVYSWCRRAGWQPSDAADIVQEVFRAVALGIQAFRRDRPSDRFRAWLWTITRNERCNLARLRRCRPLSVGGSDFQHRLQSMPDELDDGESTEESSGGRMDGVAGRILVAISGEFEPATIAAFKAMVLDGRSSAEVGAELGLSANAVRNAKSRVLRRLRSELGGD